MAGPAMQSGQRTKEKRVREEEAVQAAAGGAWAGGRRPARRKAGAKYPALPWRCRVCTGIAGKEAGAAGVTKLAAAALHTGQLVALGRVSLPSPLTESSAASATG